MKLKNRRNIYKKQFVQVYLAWDHSASINSTTLEQNGLVAEVVCFPYKDRNQTFYEVQRKTNYTEENWYTFGYW